MAKSLADARRKNCRVPRYEGRCTVCSKKLPDNIKEWGLVWETNKHGICLTCLLSTRKAVGLED